MTEEATKALAERFAALRQIHAALTELVRVAYPTEPLLAIEALQAADCIAARIHRLGGFLTPPRTEARRYELLGPASVTYRLWIGDGERVFPECFRSDELRAAEQALHRAIRSGAVMPHHRRTYTALRGRDWERAFVAPEVPND